MLKKTRALATAAVGALLLTTGATFALWQDSAAVDVDPITTGTLSVNVDDVQWLDQSAVVKNAAGALVANQSPWVDITDTIGEFVPSPGDVLVGTFTVDAEFEGTNLVAELTFPGTDFEFTSEDGLVTVEAEASEDSTEFTITITFAEGEVRGHTLDQRTEIPLGEASIVLTQVRVAD